MGYYLEKHQRPGQSILCVCPHCSFSFPVWCWCSCPARICCSAIFTPPFKILPLRFKRRWSNAITLEQMSVIVSRLVVAHIASQDLSLSQLFPCSAAGRLLNLCSSAGGAWLRSHLQCIEAYRRPSFWVHICETLQWYSNVTLLPQPTTQSMLLFYFCLFGILVTLLSPSIHHNHIQ